MSNSQATPADAELILKLYDLRREPVMREARKYVFDFAPQSIDDVMAVLGDFSSKENAYMRQVFGYWGMAASLVLRGALNEDLARDNFHRTALRLCQVRAFSGGNPQTDGHGHLRRQHAEVRGKLAGSPGAGGAVPAALCGDAQACRGGCGRRPHA